MLPSQLPRREEFILDVRGAMRDLVPPSVWADSPSINTDTISRTMYNACLWLTPKIVEQFDRQDFSAADPQGRLAGAVEAFRKIAEMVPANKPATDQQRSDGVRTLCELMQAIREIVLPEWQSAAEELVTRTEVWCEELGWRTRHVARQMSETLLGEYELHQLLIYAEQELFVLSPIARFVARGLGAFDLSIQPSFELTSVYRDYDGVWYGRLNLKRGLSAARREVWGQGVLQECIEELGSLV